MIEIVLAILALLATVAAVVFYRQSQKGREELSTAQTEAAGLAAEVKTASAQVEKLEGERNAAQEECAKAKERAASAEAELKSERDKAAEEGKRQKAMEDRFEKLAQDILEKKSENFSAHSQKQLEPLKEGMEAFRKKLDEFQTESTKERTDLKSYITHISTEAGKVSTSADNLVRAFQDSGRAQGTWGEEMLLKLLESADLREGENYITQKAHTTEEGKRQIPDVIIKLPKDKNLIIDSKVSVAAYLEYNSAEDEDARASAMQKHIHAIKNHVKELSGKNYNAGVPNSHDFVLMFISPESAYLLALRESPDLFEWAYKQNVVITGATMLMPILRAVANLWKTEEQQKNADEIAKRGAALYNKVAGLVEDMDKLGRNLETANKTYNEAQNKLQSGKGNLTTQVETMRKLGIAPTKKIPKTASVAEDEEGDEAA